MSAHRLHEVNILHKFHENPSSRLGNMEGTRKTGSNIWPSSLTLTLNRYDRNMGSAHRHREVNIWHKFNENPSSRFGDMERTRKTGLNIWPSSLTLTLNRYGQNMGIEHRLHEVNTWHKFHENPSSRFGDMGRTRKTGSNLWPSSLTLTLNRYGRSMGPAHRLHEVNIWHKFHENPLSRFGDMEWARKTGSNLWPSNLTLTLNLYGRNMGSAHRLHEVNIWHKFHENPSSRFGDMERTRFWTDRRTDGQTESDGQISSTKTIYPLYTVERHIIN